MWDGTGKQSAGTYYHVVDWNQGLFSFVDETGAVQAKASQTTTISYSYATNVVKYDIDLPADTDADMHYNALLRSEEHTSELQSLMRTSYAVYCLKKKKQTKPHT